MEESLENHQFVVPEKLINSEAELARFQTSECKKNIEGLILALQESVKRKTKSSTEITQNAQDFVPILDAVYSWIDEIPPLEQPQRFGNRAFSTLQSRIQEQGRELIRTYLRTKSVGEALIEKDCDSEILGYLSQSFGDPSRIDYGTGHELNFFCVLMVLFCLGYFEDQDRSSVVHHIFWKYVRVMRKIQDTYRLEPAGSHGVWGLDDYHFLPFIFGSSELVDHPEYTPNSIHDEGILRRESDEYMYFHCIKYIKDSKTGHFGEHSPMLNDISGVVSWNKVSQGLVKMYKVEVLNKFPVMKHFLFGSVITFK